MANPTRTPAVVDARATQRMANYRQQNLDRLARPIKRTNYPEGDAGDAAYRQALMQQYENLRLVQYDYVVRDESLKAYNLARDGERAGINPNTAWGGYTVDHPDFLQNLMRERQVERIDTAQTQCQRALTEQYTRGIDGMNNLGGGANSCAVVAISLQTQISNKMDYCGDNNIITGNANMTMARDCCTCAPNEYRIRQPENGGRTVGQMIRSGTLDVGDEVSVYIPKHDNSGARTESGHHAITIASINRDRTGRITGYTAQASNGTAFRDNGFSNHVVCSAIRSHDWMNDRIKDEQNALLIVTPSLEELREQERQKLQTQGKTADQIEQELPSAVRQARLAVYNQKSQELTPQFKQQGLKGNALTEAVNNAIVADQQQILANQIAQERGLSGDALTAAANQEYYARINQDIQATSQQVGQVITGLQQSEQYAAEHSGYLREATTSYNQELNRMQQNTFLQPMQGVGIQIQQEQLDLNLHVETPQFFDNQGNAIWNPRHKQQQGEPAVQPVDGQQQQQGGQQNDGEPVVHPVTSQNQEIRRIEDAAMLKGGYTELQADVRTAQDAARTQNQQIAQQQQQTELAAAEPQKTQDNKQTELTPAMQAYLQNQRQNC